MSDTPEILWPAIRQYRHNNDSSPSLSSPAGGFVIAYDGEMTKGIVRDLQARIAELEQRQEPQTGAIANGLALLERLKSNYWFTDEYGKALAKTPDFIELELCLQHLQGEHS